MKILFKTLIIGSSLLLGACVSQSPVQDTRMKSFHFADRNHDGALSYGEYKEYLSLRADRGDKDAQRVEAGSQNPEKAKLLSFQSVDTNRDNYISPEELVL